MVLLILVLLWAVVLTPHFVRKWLDRRPAGSIESFHHQLHLLERTGPKLVSPAYRLETAHPAGDSGQAGLVPISSTPLRPNLVLLQPVGGGDAADCADVVDETSGEHYRRLSPPVEVRPTAPLSAAPRADELRRLRARRRRRDVFLGLVATVLVTGLAGIAPTLHGLWVLTGLAGLALAAYVGLALYAQLLAAETDTAPRHAPRHASRPQVVAARDATAGYPGGWDTDVPSEDDGLEPQRAAAAR